MIPATDRELALAKIEVEWVSPVSELQVGFVGEASLDMYRFFPYAVDIEKLSAAFTKISQIFKEFSSVLLHNGSGGFRVGYVANLLHVEVHALDEDYVWDPLIGFHRYVTPVTSVPGQPLYKVTATRLRNGTVVAESLSHVVADGFTRYVFLQHITAEMCDRSVPEPFGNVRSERFHRADDAPESYDERGRPLGVSCQLREVSDVGRRARFFYSLRLDRQWIADTRTRYSLGNHLTSSDIITGYLLKNWGLAMCPGSASGFCARVPVDIRSLLGGSDLNLGNAFVDAIIPGKPHDWADISIEHAAATVHESVLLARSRIQQVCGEHQHDRPLKDQAWFTRLSRQMASEHPFSHESDIVISNILKLPYDTINYGRGPAIDLFSANAASSSFVLYALGSEIIVAISSPAPLVVNA